MRDTTSHNHLIYCVQLILQSLLTCYIWNFLLLRGEARRHCLILDLHIGRVLLVIEIAQGKVHSIRWVLERIVAWTRPSWQERRAGILISHLAQRVLHFLIKDLHFTLDLCDRSQLFFLQLFFNVNLSLDALWSWPCRSSLLNKLQQALSLSVIDNIVNVVHRFNTCRFILLQSQLFISFGSKNFTFSRRIKCIYLCWDIPKRLLLCGWLL